MKYISKRGVVVWFVCLAILLAWSGLVVVDRAGSNQEYKAAQREAAKEIHFYREVAGTDNEHGGMLNKLALDLRGMTVKELAEFKGDANRYGGIKDELGFDPFDGANCSECGPLSRDVYLNVIAVKRGNLNAVVSTIEVEKPSTLPGPPMFAWVLLILIWPALITYEWLKTSRVETKRNQAMPDEMELIRNMDRALEGTFGSPDERYDLQALRNRLMAEVDARVKYGELAGHKMKVNELTEEAQSSLEAIQEGNKVLNQP